MSKEIDRQEIEDQNQNMGIGGAVGVKQDLEYMEKLIKLRYMAHYAMLLAVTGRVTNEVNRINQYNKILSKYILYLATLTDFENRVRITLHKFKFTLIV